MADFFFDLPVWVPIALLMVAVGLFIYGNNRSNNRIRLASAGVVGLTIVLVCVSLLVDTFQEKCVKRTQAIVEAFNAQDWEKVRSLVDDATIIYGLRGKNEIADVSKQLAADWGFQTAHILIVTPLQVPNAVEIRARIVHDFAKVSVKQTLWEFRYEKRGDAIELETISLVDEPTTPSKEMIKLIHK